MNLFYAPGACSLAIHIALVESGMLYTLVSVDRDKQTVDGRDFNGINPKGFIPAIEFDDGSVLAESFVILLYIAHHSGKLLPRDGFVRWQALEATSFMTTEIHGNFKPFWKNATQPEKDKAHGLLVKHFGTIAHQLGDRPFLTGDHMTIADPYLYVMLRWAAKHGIEVSESLECYAASIKELPSVVRALVEEGIAWESLISE